MTRHGWINIFHEDFNPLVKLAFPLALTGLISTAVGFFQTIFFARLGQEVMSAGALSSWLFGVFIMIICAHL